MPSTNQEPQFKSIATSTPFKELRNVTYPRDPDALTITSLLTHLNPQISQLKSDLASIRDIVKSDVETELEQLVDVDEKIRSSEATLRVLYRTTLRNRRRNAGFTSCSREFDNLVNGVQDVSARVSELDSVVDKILDNLIDVDSRLPELERVFCHSHRVTDSSTGRAVNEEHYPLVFELLKRRYPQRFDVSEVQTNSGDVASYEDTTESDQMNVNTSNNNGGGDTITTVIKDNETGDGTPPVHEHQLSIKSEKDTEELSNSAIKPVMQKGPIVQKLLLPSFKGPESPSTLATLETASALGLVRPSSASTARVSIEAIQRQTDAMRAGDE